MAKVLAAFPQARWHAYEPVDDFNVREGARLAFGREAAGAFSRVSRKRRRLSTDFG